MTDPVQTPSHPAPSARRSWLSFVAPILLAGILTPALLVAGARWWSPGTLSGPVRDGGWIARERPWFLVSGFSPAEVDVAARRHFSWTEARSQFHFPQLDRSQGYWLTLRVSASRPADAPPPPEMTLHVDGISSQTFLTTNESQRLSIGIPAAAAHGAVVDIDVSNTFKPANDNREIGVVVDDISLVAERGRFQPTAGVVQLASLAAAACMLGLVLSGLRARFAFAGALAVSAGFAWLLLQEGAFLGVYPERLAHLGTGIGVLGGVVALVRWRWPAVPGLPEFWTATALVAGLSAVKLAFLVHPLVTVGDAIFQVHRAQYVHAGQYFFTSITPRPFFEFPYPIALFVAAQPFWSFFPTEADLVRLLRGVTLAADALVGIVLYAAARRQWNNKAVALLCACLWPLARGPFHGMCNANLTNVFGQGVFGVGMGLAGWLAAGTALSPVALAGVGVALAIAFLSHFSTLSVGLAIIVAVSAVLWTGGGYLRRLSLWILVVFLAAVAVSYAVYYSRFHDVYRTTATRVLSEEREATGRSIAAPPAIKVRLWLAGATNDYGLPGAPVLIISGVGAALLARRWREGLTRVLGGWAAVWIVFSGLGMLTPVEMRASLAAAPVFVCLSAYALGSLSRHSRAGAVAASLGVTVVMWDAVRAWMMCLGL